MFDDPAIRAMQEETAQCIREIAVAALDWQLSRHIQSEKERLW